MILCSRLVNLHTDYAMFVEWWIGHDWPPVAQEMLPSIGLLITEFDEESHLETNICAGWLYFTDDSPMAWSEWIVTNPEAGSDERNRGLNLLMKGMEDWGTRYGAKLIFTSCSDAGLIERYKEHGFMVTDENMTNLVRRLV